MNYNFVALGGNLTRDPTLSYLPSQTSVCEFGIAVNKKWTGKDGEQKSKVLFIDCIAFAKTGETINQYLKKGDPLFVQGEIQLDQWKDKDGNNRSKHKVVVSSFQFLSSGEKQTGQADETDNDPVDDVDDIPF